MIKYKKKQMNKTYSLIKLIIINFLFFYPMIFNYTLYKIQDSIVILLIIYCIFLIFTSIKKQKISMGLLILILFEVWMLLATIFNYNVNNLHDYIIWFRNAVITIGLEIYIENELKKNAKEFIKSIYLLFSFYVYLNFILIIVFPNGLVIKQDSYVVNMFYTFKNSNAFYFLGHKNNSTLILMPLLIISNIYFYYFNTKRYKKLLIITLVMIEAIYMGSSTCILGCIMIIIYMIFKNKKIAIFNYKYNIIISIALFFIIVIFRLQNLFSFIIENIFNKSISLTGRTVVWDNAINLIFKSPLFGYGTHLEGSIIFHSYKYWYAHNYILDILIQGGIIAIIYIFILRIYIYINISKVKNHLVKTALAWGIFCFEIVSLVESYHNFTGYLLIFLLAYNISYLDKVRNDIE